MEDHIHFFVICSPTLAPDQIMFRLKGYTSRVLRQEFPHLLRPPSMWTRSYFVALLEMRQARQSKSILLIKIHANNWTAALATTQKSHP